MRHLRGLRHASGLLGSLACVALGCGSGSISPTGGDPGAGGDAGPAADGAPGSPIEQPVPLVPSDDNSSGVSVDGNGDLVLDPDETANVFSYIWIANSPDGTVSKIDTTTGNEVGRYRTGPGAPDPSRTTVGLDGDVVVANRGGASAVRIHSQIASCPDVNGNGVVDTSSGPTDIRAWGADECVLWFHQFAGGSLARAAAYDFVIDPDGEITSTVWVGLFNAQKIVRLSAETGDVLAEIDVPGHCPYGLAFDGTDEVFAFDACGARLLRLNTSTLAWTSMPIPGGCAYGITVDPDGRVWTSGGNCVARYDQAVGTWQTVNVGSSNRGLAADGDGSVWIADSNFGVHRLDAATMATLNDIPLSGNDFVGVAVDFHDQIWAVSRGSSLALRIDPVTLATASFPTGTNPYTYSDMTGFQLQNAAPPLGTYVALVEGCGDETQWWTLAWSATTNPGTFVRFRARAGDSINELEARPWAFLAQQPDAMPPVDLIAALEATGAGNSFGAFLQIEIVLGSTAAGLTPVLHSVSVTRSCDLVE